MTAPCLSDVTGQPRRIIGDIVRAYLERRPILFIGEPGAAIPMIARRLPSILPEMTHHERDALLAIYASARLEVPEDRPYRAPHHSVSIPGMLGTFSDSGWRPGEVSLAYGGVLFFDEIEEVPPTILRTVASSVSDGALTFVKAASHRKLPARVALVAASTRPGADVPALRDSTGFDWLPCEVPTVSNYRRVNTQAHRWPTSEDVRSNLLGLL